MTHQLWNIGDFVEFVPMAINTSPLPKLWYLLRLHPNCDLKAERDLQERGISAYVPKMKQTIRTAWSRRKKLTTVPIFPGAMFVPDYEADIEKLRDSATGIGGFVKCAGEALRISLRTMDEVRRFETKQNRHPDQRKFKPGQKVRIIGGPFDLLEGSIQRLDPRFRITVLINLLQGEVPAQFDEDQVETV